MHEAPNVVLHPSKMPDWLACSERAAYEEQKQLSQDIPRDGIPVRQVVGNAVHAAVSGVDYHLPARIEFDATTRTIGEMERQVASMAGTVVAEIERQGLVFEAVEQAMTRNYRIGDILLRVTGRVDLRCSDPEGTTVIVDIKTGVSPPARVWPQMSIYGLQERVECDLAVLWVQRPKGAAQPKAPIFVRKSASLLKDAAAGYLRMRAYFQKHGTTPSPSAMTCRDCPVEGCEVRAIT